MLVLRWRASARGTVRVVAGVVVLSAVVAAGPVGSDRAMARTADQPTTVTTGFSTTTTVPTTTLTTTTLPSVDRRGLLVLERTLSEGKLKFEPPVGERPRSSSSSALTIATRSLRSKPKSDRPELFFALFSATSPTQRNADGTVSPLFDKRPVWVVRFPNVIGKRQSGIVQRKGAPTTTSLEVLTEIVVIVDDRSGKVVLTSEYNAG